MELRPKGSGSTCILPGISAFLHAAFTAHMLLDTKARVDHADTGRVYSRAERIVSCVVLLDNPCFLTRYRARGFLVGGVDAEHE